PFRITSLKRFALCCAVRISSIVSRRILSVVSSVLASALVLYISSDIFTFTHVTSPSKQVFSFYSSNLPPHFIDEDFGSFTQSFLVSVSPKRAAFLNCTFKSTVGIPLVSCIFENGLSNASSNQSSTNPFNISKNLG